MHSSYGESWACSEPPEVVSENRAATIEEHLTLSGRSGSNTAAPLEMMRTRSFGTRRVLKQSRAVQLAGEKNYVVRSHGLDMAMIHCDERVGMPGGERDDLVNS